MAINGVSGGSFTIRRVNDGVTAAVTITPSRGFQSIFNAATSNYLGTGNWDVSDTDGSPGAANILNPVLIVNGAQIMNGDTRVTAINWAYRDTATGAFVDISGAVDTANDGFNIVTRILQIERNLDQTANYPTNSITASSITLRATYTFDFGTRTGLSASGVLTLNRSELTESSISYWVRKDAGPFWNVADTADKVYTARIFIGAAEATGVTFEWQLAGVVIATTASVTVARADVDSSAVLSLRIFHPEIGGTSIDDPDLLVESIELFDLLDPISFVERVDSVVGDASDADGVILPYRNGSPMGGLTTVNSEWRFRMFQVSNGNQRTYEFATRDTTRGSLVDGTGTGAFTAGFYADDEVTLSTADASAFVWRTATEVDVDGTNDGAEIRILSSELEIAGSNVRVDYELELKSF